MLVKQRLAVVFVIMLLIDWCSFHLQAFMSTSCIDICLRVQVSSHIILSSHTQQESLKKCFAL